MAAFWPRVTIRILKAQVVAQFSPGFALQNGQGNEFGSNAGTSGLARLSMPAMLSRTPAISHNFKLRHYRGFED